jgi:hypothetical protein
VSPDLEKTLAMIADVSAAATEPWWIIASAAVVLHGANTTVADVDLLMGSTDARRILENLGVSSIPDTGHPQFRSKIFGTWREPPLPVEIFADFSLRAAKGWRSIRLETRERIEVAGRALFVPSKEELRSLLLSFGRAKDLERASLLDD